MYQFIGNEEDVRKFYQLHISQFNTHDFNAFIIIPIARRKYCPSLSCSQFTISTRIFSTKDNVDKFVQELKKYEIADGLYKDGDNSIPSSAMAIYMTVNPMNEMNAFFKFQEEMMKRVQEMLNGNTVPSFSESVIPRNEEVKSACLQALVPVRSTITDHQPVRAKARTDFKMTSLYKSCLHKSSENLFVKLDVDTKEEEKITVLREFLTPENYMTPYMVIESRGGYHVLLYKNANNRALYEFLQGKDWVTQEKNALVIIPGTYQGGFLTKIVQW